MFLRRLSSFLRAILGQESHVPRDRVMAVAVDSQRIVCEKWLKLILSTDPLEPSRAQAAITSLFRAGAPVEGSSRPSRRPPQTILVCQSPASAALTMMVLRAPPLLRWRGNYLDDDFRCRHSPTNLDPQPVETWRARFPDGVWSSASRSAALAPSGQGVGRQVSADQQVTAAHMRLRLYQSKEGLRESKRDRVLRQDLLEICWQGLPAVGHTYEALWGAVCAAAPAELRAYVESFRPYIIFDGDEYDLLPDLIEYDYLQEVCGSDCTALDAFCRIYRDELAGLVELAGSCGGWVLYEN